MKRLVALLFLFLTLSSCVSASPTVTPPRSTPQPDATEPVIKSKPEPWWRDAIFYEIFVRSFNDSNGDGIGDFNGITQKLDYLQQLGVNAIWLMPIHPSPSYHGYDVVNYYAVNSDYGTMDDFKHLLSEVHKRNMHLIIDLVLNHTSSQHPFFKDALNDPSSIYHDWYVWSDTDQGIGWHPVMDNKALYYYGFFCDCMPDLNYHNPNVTAQMENVVHYWLNNIGVDGFRIDAADYLIEEGSKLRNTKSTHEWYQGFYQAYKADNPNAFTIGEVYGAGASIAKTFNDQLDQIFNFELATSILNSVNGGSNTGINSALTFALQDMPSGDYGTFLTNHDQNRVMNALYGDVNKAKVSAFLLLTSPGTPFIYYGEEVGMQGAKPDEDIRRPMQWASSNNAGFTTGTPWEALDPNYAQVNVAAQEQDSNSLLNFYRRMIALRNEHPALRTGSLGLLTTRDSGLYAALRINQQETLLILANLGNHPITDSSLNSTQAVLPAGSYSLTSLLGPGSFASLQVGADQKISDFKPLPEIPAYGMYVLQVSLIK